MARVLSGAEESDYPAHLPAVGTVDPGPAHHHGRRDAGHRSHEEVAAERPSAYTATGSHPGVPKGVRVGRAHGHVDSSNGAWTDGGRGRWEGCGHRDGIRPEASAVAAISAIGRLDGHRAGRRTGGCHEARIGNQVAHAARTEGNRTRSRLGERHGARGRRTCDGCGTGRAPTYWERGGETRDRGRRRGQRPRNLGVVYVGGIGKAGGQSAHAVDVTPAVDTRRTF